MLNENIYNDSYLLSWYQWASNKLLKKVIIHVFISNRLKMKNLALAKKKKEKKLR